MDTLITFETGLSGTGGALAPVRYAVRQVMDQEYQKNIIVREKSARQARYRAGNPHEGIDAVLQDKENHVYQIQDKVSDVKRDFFGRVVQEAMPLQEIDGNAEVDAKGRHSKKGLKEDGKVWVSFHEGFSNAVRKPITIEELLRDL